MSQSPGSRLWIFLVKVGKKGFVRQVLQAGRVISHEVDRSGEVEAAVTVAKEALVGAFQIAEEGRGTVAGDGAFVEAG